MIIQNTENKPFNELSLEERKYIANLFAEGRQEELEASLVNWTPISEEFNLIMDRPYRTKVKHAPLNIPWNVLDGRWKFAAMDQNLDVYVFADKPFAGRSQNYVWYADGDYQKVNELLIISNLPSTDLWRSTLTERQQTNEERSPQASVLSKQEGAAAEGGIYGGESQAMDLLKEFDSFMDSTYDWPDTTDELRALCIFTIKVREFLEQQVH